MAQNIDLKAIQELLRLLRAEGVLRFSSDSLSVELGALPLSASDATGGGKLQIPDQLRGLPPEYFDPALGIAWKVE